jgi:hypothetical protein
MSFPLVIFHRTLTSLPYSSHACRVFSSEIRERVCTHTHLSTHVTIIFVVCFARGSLNTFMNHPKDYKSKKYSVGFEVFTLVVIKDIIFWDKTPCSPLSFNRRFGGTYRLHLQGRINRFSKPASNQVASRMLSQSEDRYIWGTEGK